MNGKKHSNIWLAVCLLLAVLAGPAAGRTIYVDPNGSADFITIQAAIDDANNGDEVEVAPGTYNEAINFNGKAIRLYSKDGPEVTIIDANGIPGAFHVVQCISGEYANTILEGFTITGGNANGVGATSYGGGMYCESSSPTVTNCIFRGNRAGYGGGMLNDASSPIVTDCNFTDNTATSYGGGMENFNGGSATVTNCTFSYNTATNYGGGMINNGSDPNVTNCTFSNNSANHGGGMYNLDNSNPMVTDCNFTGNTATIHGGGGMFNNNSSPTVSNCTFIGNTSESHGGGMNNGNGSNPNVYNCTFSGNEAGGHGGGMYNYESSPTVIGCVFYKNRTGDGATGDPGGPGGHGGGMFNAYASPTLIDCTFTENVTGNGGDGGRDALGHACRGGEGGSGAGMYNLASSPNLTNCTLTGNRTGNGGNGPIGFGLIEHGGGGGGAGHGGGMGNFNSSPVVTGCTFIRNETGRGGNGGMGGPGGSGLNGGHGAGMYNANGSSPTVDNCSFTENECGNGGHGGSGFDAYITFFFIFTTSGEGGAGGHGGEGAGMWNDNNSSPAVSNSTFTGNKCGDGGCGGRGGDVRTPVILGLGAGLAGGAGGNGGSGGAMRNNKSSSPSVTGCTFSANKTGNGGNGGRGRIAPVVLAGGGQGGDGGDAGIGAGIANRYSSPNVSDCAFYDNETGVGGLAGGLGYSGLWTLLGLRGQKNGWSGRGGGIGNWESSPALSNCTFRGNTAIHEGGGMWNYQSPPTVTNCIFSKNAANYGGGICNGWNSQSIVTNCTFTQNAAAIDGGGMYNDQSSPTVTNSIFWDNEPNEIVGPEPNLTYCDVAGGYAGTGNINVNPVFADDDGRLSLGSLCIDFGSNSAPNLPDRDFDGNPRIMGGTVDMGAFECTDLRIRNETTDDLYGSIQAAIDDANDRDWLRVLPGTYYSEINFNGKAVRLYSTSGPEFTTIDATIFNSSVVTCNSGEDANTILDGFTITGGYAMYGGGMINYNSSPTVINCIFSGNLADVGGGMFNDNSSNPAVTNCTFEDNEADVGGGMANYTESSPTLTNCTFKDNSARAAGGMSNFNNSSPRLTNCNFTGNIADDDCGGMSNHSGSNAILTNCIFICNSAGKTGGGMQNAYSTATLTNCTFSGNTAGLDGGGMKDRGGSNSTVTNCIFWGDTPDELFVDQSTPTVTYSDVQGGWSGAGANNINADPCFIDTPSSNFWLFSSDSPCVDTGDSNAPPLAGEDLDGNPRAADGDGDGNCVVDMGAYELHPRVVNVTRNCYYQAIQCSIDDANDGDRIVANVGTYHENIDFKGKNIVLTSTDPNDPAVVRETIIDGKDYGAVVTFQGQQGPSCVLDGFTVTANPHIGPNSPIVGIECFQSSPTIRNSIVMGIGSYGREGYGIKCNAASPVISKCIVRHIAMFDWGAVALADGSNAIIEDCTLTENFSSLGQAAGVSSTFSDPTIVRCVISENVGPSVRYSWVWGSGGGGGGGILCVASNAVIEDCVISNNSGTGIQCGFDANTTIRRCTIAYNSTRHTMCGGITHCKGPIEDCVITANSGVGGGGLYDCTGAITNCLIAGNQADYGAGVAHCSGPIANSVIAGNRGGRGGGLESCDGAISNCTIVGNVAVFTGDANTGLGGGLYDCNGIISNSIIRRNWAEIGGDQLYSCSEPNYSCIQDWTGGGVGNITTDPCFVLTGYWADANDPNIVVEPNDPNGVWLDGNYRLARGSPCIDAGDNNSVSADTADLDGDGDVNEPMPFDLGGLPRFVDDLCTVDTGNPGTLGPPVVDMGAYELLPADIDTSSVVDFRDYSLIAAHWLETGCGLCGGANLNCDGKVDFNDLLLLADWWLVGIKPEL